ncbi:DNA/RNA helicase, superfamily II [Sanguibacter keddieii DSM 10542]|uniref:RNA helicase n=1 Tax=Sanguibacter keddieii (strain ATCC 51767 / DSM 10542 / NCFB 3025 / ST-74) TaxID=446469 RepID=D1BH27_SANKS|nr:DEAD/DEAH box helicase [Sanguibacter keddieii]ACZ21747.1 DNA/RNA helicase, superfamily II [Sanguibacter keddieii DSM 10542]
MTSLDTTAPERAQNTPTENTVATSPVAEAITFADLGLPAELLSAVLDLGFTVPSTIQEKAIPALLAGNDITGVAQTGTGKTAAFGLPMLAAVDPELRRTQALVLAPTRELAMQVAEAIETFAKHLPGIEVVPVYGGSPYPPQARALSRGAQIVVGTPGRVIDHLERGTLKLGDIRFLVLDEADEMLRMGFAEDVEKIFGAAPTERQVALFSATMPPQIRRVAQHHMRQPVEIAVSRQSSTVTSVTQQYAVVPFRHKVGSLTRVLATSDADAAIVFCRTRGAAEEVGSALIERGISAATISGDVAQKDREKIVERLRAGALDVLVATDVAARGLDVDRIGLVVNFDIPGEPEAYVHRIGRTGRAGRTGVALSFVTPNERGRLKQIERTIRQQLVEIEIPSPADVSAHKVATLLGRVDARRDAGRLSMYTDLVRTHLDTHGTDPAELAAILAALAVGDDGPQAREEEAAFEAQRAEARDARKRRDDDRAPRERRDNDRPSRGVRRESTGTRYRLSVGHTHGAQPSGIVGALTNEGGLSGKDLGKIDIFPSFSLVDISAPLDSETIDKISRARVAGKALRIKLDDGPAPTRTPRAGGAPAGRREERFDRKPRTEARY